MMREWVKDIGRPVKFLILFYVNAGVLLASCGRDGGVVIEEAFLPYIETLQEEAKNQNLEIIIRNIEIRFGELPAANLQGVCRTYTFGGKEIVINPESWKFSTQNERLNIIAHEIGHCNLGQGHEEGLTFMNPTKLHDEYISANYADLMSDYMNRVAIIQASGNLPALSSNFQAYILNTPKRVSEIGAWRLAAKASDSTSRVFQGAMMPSSHKCAEL